MTVISPHAAPHPPVTPNPSPDRRPPLPPPASGTVTPVGSGRATLPGGPGAWGPSVLVSEAAVVLTATLGDGVLALGSPDSAVSVQVPLDGWAGVPVPPTWHADLPDGVARVCALDAALARRLFRRVTAWRPDGDGRLSARVRPCA